MNEPVVITRQSLANEAASRWRAQYASGIYGLDKLAIADDLDALGSTPQPDAVDEVIGNGSWTMVPICHWCGTGGHPAVVQVGESPDYESATTWLCRQCVTQAAAAIDKARGSV